MLHFHPDHWVVVRSTMENCLELESNFQRLAFPCDSFAADSFAVVAEGEASDDDELMKMDGVVTRFRCRADSVEDCSMTKRDVCDDCYFHRLHCVPPTSCQCSPASTFRCC